MDYRPTVLGMPDSLMTFGQTYRPDMLEIVPAMFTGMFDFTPLLHDQELDGGMELVPIIEEGGSSSESEGWHDDWSESESESESENWNTSLSQALGWSRSQASALGQTEQESNSQQETGGVSRKIDPDNPLRTQNEETRNNATAVGKAQVRGNSLVATDTNGQNGTVTNGSGEGGGKSRDRSKGLSGGNSGSRSETRSWSRRYLQVRKVIRQKVKTGQLERSIADQIEERIRDIFCLKPREAFVRIGSEAVKIRTHDVPDPFVSPTALVKAVQWLVRELAQVHSYLFVPDLSVEEEERRVNEFLANPAAAVLIDDELA